MLKVSIQTHIGSSRKRLLLQFKLMTMIRDETKRSPLSFSPALLFLSFPRFLFSSYNVRNKFKNVETMNESKELWWAAS